MKKFKNLFACILCLTMKSFILVSCNDGDDPALQGSSTDVYIQDQKTNYGVKYAIFISSRLYPLIDPALTRRMGQH